MLVQLPSPPLLPPQAQWHKSLSLVHLSSLISSSLSLCRETSRVIYLQEHLWILYVHSVFAFISFLGPKWSARITNLVYWSTLWFAALFHCRDIQDIWGLAHMMMDGWWWMDDDCCDLFKLRFYDYGSTKCILITLITHCFVKLNEPEFICWVFAHCNDEKL